MSTPNRARLLKLAEECEAAAGPDRRLDCFIHVETIRTSDGVFSEVPPGPWKETRWFYNPVPSVDWIGYDLLNIAPHYTASLDAAVSLVPDKMDWAIGSSGGKRRKSSESATPALALCAAALRALAKEKPDA